MYGPEHGARLDAGVVADEHGALDDGVGRHVDALADPDPLANLEAGHLDADLAVEQLLVRGAVRLERADVFPVAVDDGSEQLQAAVEHGREHVAREVDDLALGDELEHARVEHVDARVDRVGEHLAPGRLLEEPLDRAVGAGDHDAEVDGVLDPLQRDRRERALRHDGARPRAPRSMSVSTSPEMTRNVSSSSAIALRTEPAVPSGASSVAYRMRTPSSEPSPK